MPEKKRYSLNVIAPFYVEDGCCTSCGVPQSIAPELFAENEQEYCYVRRQPEGEAETDAMLRVVATQESVALRVGEVKAIRWREDIDMIAKTVTVNLSDPQQTDNHVDALRPRGRVSLARAARLCAARLACWARVAATWQQRPATKRSQGVSLT